MTAIIETKHLNCQSGFRYLLEDINWTVQPGQRWVIFGQNGSGKTTLLSIIAGCKQATGGEVKLFGQPFTNSTILALRRQIGWVSSSFFDRYYHRESALDIVLAGKSGTFSVEPGLTAADIRFAKHLLCSFNLKNKIDRGYHTLSKGERQSVLISRALFCRPKLLLLDEPSAGLDVQARAHLLAVLDQLAQDPALTIAYVTHYTEEIRPAFTHMLLLRDGHIFKQGALADLFTENVLSEFLRHPVTLKTLPAGERLLSLQVASDVGGLLQGRENT